jgi:FAD synthase
LELEKEVPPYSMNTLKKTPKLINSLDKKLELLEDIGIQAVVILDFTEEFSKISFCNTSSEAVTVR